MKKLRNSRFLKFKFWIDFLYPNRCACCDELIAWDAFCCAECEQKLPYAGVYCKQCGKHDCICEREDFNKQYDACVTALAYEDIAKDGILRCKLEGLTNLPQMLVPALCEVVRKISAPEIVCYVPMTHAQQSQRGFNQARDIARISAKQLDLPLLDGVLRKTDSTLQQHALSRQARLAAVRGAYTAGKHIDAVRGKCVLLCDDIITTGSTLNECARLLRQGGASKVLCLTLATTKYRTKQSGEEERT